MTYQEVPKPARWVADFIQRIGYPIFVSLALMVYIVYRLDRQEISITEVLERNTTALIKDTEAVTALRHALTHKYDPE